MGFERKMCMGGEGFIYIKRNSLNFALDLLYKVSPKSVSRNEIILIELKDTDDSVLIKCKRKGSKSPFFVKQVSLDEIREAKRSGSYEKSLRYLLISLDAAQVKTNQIFIEVRGYELVDLDIV